MAEYGRGQLIEALRRIDAVLNEPTTVTLIGGSVAVLQWRVDSATKDIDVLYGPDSTTFVAASEQVRQVLTTGMPPVQSVSIASLPFDYEARCEEYPLGLVRLRILVPESHDWAIAKIVRGNQEDIEAVAEVNESSPFDTQTLIERYLDTDVFGPRSAFRTSFLAALSWWLPEEDVERIEERLAATRASGSHARERDD